MRILLLGFVVLLRGYRQNKARKRFLIHRMMLRLCAMLFVALATLGNVAYGVGWGELSSEAKNVIPPSVTNQVLVTLANGTSISGEIFAKDDKGITIISSPKGIATKTFASRSQITNVAPADVSDLFADAILRRVPASNESVEKREMESTLALIDEFLRKCKGSARYSRMERIRDLCLSELSHLKNGDPKISGKWIASPRDAIELIEQKLEEIESLQKLRQVNPKQEAAYRLRIMNDMRDIAKHVPMQVEKWTNQSMLNKGAIETARDVLNPFMQYWIRCVIPLEIEKRRSLNASGIGYGSVFDMMNFDQVLSLFRSVDNDYRKSQATKGIVPVTTNIPDGMVYVPGGLMLMGDANSKPGDPSFPLHFVFVGPFLMDRFEVSNKEFREFANYVNRTKEVWMEHEDAPPMKKHYARTWDSPDLAADDLPAMGVDWYDAYSYANWKGKRLPSEAEWEFAAGGCERRSFPWGDKAPDSVAANCQSGRRFLSAEMAKRAPPTPPPRQESHFGCSFFRSDTSKATTNSPTVLPSLRVVTWPVNHLLPPEAVGNVGGLYTFMDVVADISPFGVHHMGGNAAEWVADYYCPTIYSSMYLDNPLVAQVSDVDKIRDVVLELHYSALKPPSDQEIHVFRGGSYLTGSDGDLKTWKRNAPASFHGKFGCSNENRPFIGFRCIKPLHTERCSECGGSLLCSSCGGFGVWSLVCTKCICSPCRGSGRCFECNGRGMVQCPGCASGDNRQTVVSVCPSCNGVGYKAGLAGGPFGTMVGKCVVCYGSGRVAKEVSQACRTCRGAGLMPCGLCAGKKVCAMCDGACRRQPCNVCKGNGQYTWVCEDCLGIGRCQRCGDAGIRMQIAALKKRSSTPAGYSKNDSKQLVLSAIGSGVAITPDGYILTCRHIMRDESKVFVRTAKGLMEASVMGVDAATDLALLKVSSRFKPLCFATQPPDLDEIVRASGYPSPSLTSLVTTISTGVVRRLAGIQNDSRYLCVGSLGERISPGSAFVSSKGALIGIAIADLQAELGTKLVGNTDESLGLVLKTKDIVSFLNKYPNVVDQLIYARASKEYLKIDDASIVEATVQIEIYW